MFCGIGELGAAITASIAPASPLRIQGVLDDIYKLDGRHGVRIHEVGAAFGDIDVIVLVATPIEPTGGVHPTWRIAKFVEELRAVGNVVDATTSILLHDEHHDLRHRTAALK